MPSAAAWRSSVALDWRVIARDAFVSLPEISLGIPLTWGTLPRLVNLVGPARAKRLAILCERVSAADALAMGLVDELCEPGGALQAARGTAEQGARQAEALGADDQGNGQRLRQPRRPRRQPHGAATSSSSPPPARSRAPRAMPP